MRYKGIIGVKNPIPVETSPGVYEIVVDDVSVCGDIYNNRAAWSNAGQNQTVLKMVLSIIPPETPDISVNEVVYVEYQQVKWSVVSIEYERPRVKLTLGGRYNG